VQDIRWNAFWLSLTLIIACLILWAATDLTTALIVFSLGIVVYLSAHLYWLHKLHGWLKKPRLSTLPNGSGVWEDIFVDLYHQQRRHSRSQTQLASALDRFREAARALPDGVVLLNNSDQIEWCNPPAEDMLGLELPQDANQPINYLLRTTDFIDYLQSADYTHPIKIKSWRNADITLEIQLVLFGDHQKLLTCRDVSQLEKLEAMRRDFIANVSHELRTPLTVVGGFLETLSDMKDAVPESSRNYFSMMLEQTARMRHLVEDLLALSQLENRVTAPQDSKIDITSLLDMVMTEAKSLSNGQHNITLNMADNLTLTGSMEELHSAFSNLVSNAIRYTPKDGNIILSWEAQGKEAVFSVKDSGIGIEEQHIERLTERFYRIDSSRSRETGGTGLGLSIVKHILAHHQARLEIHSQPGKGSIFSVIFPEGRLIYNQP
jgi:two-component system phosphate regulon sensor histidine kinase PhoR